jgi:Protein of unknown function DUF86
MPYVGPRARLEDILEAIREIEGFASGGTFQDCLDQSWLRFARKRRIEIVSEASRRLPADLKAKHAEILWADIAGNGNILRHGLRPPRPCGDLGRGGERSAAPQSGRRGDAEGGGRN